MLFDYNKKELKRVQEIAERVISTGKEIEQVDDYFLKNAKDNLKERLDKGESIDDLLPLAFAVCREASHRVLGKKHYLSQIIGGIVIHQGRVAEMKTGEGKTLTELLPAYLNAITGKGVHVITVNDYLAKRDYEEMKPLFDFLGITVGFVGEDSTEEERRNAYNCDITYTTNTELGFDYLRDNLCQDIKDKVQRELNYVIIDEIDSVLIDEARTPLIISQPGEAPSPWVNKLTDFVNSLSSRDYDIDEKEDKIVLTEVGYNKAENFTKLNLTLLENSDVKHYIDKALRAKYLMKVDKDYIIKDKEIIIIDEGTGRPAVGRRYSDGLHQALESKEGLEVKRESITKATITYQNFFRLYNKISGMSGTVATEEIEFREIYSLDVVVVPTNKPIQRIDNADLIFKSKSIKYEYLVNDIINTKTTGRPILISAPTIKISEEISELLKKRNIKHELLNAKNNEMEAEIISKAGTKGAITISTAMAGRGTDIKLTDEVKRLGGLKVIGVERSESKRIDNQLIGRAGRQGDPGESQFYVSYEDRLLDIFLPKSIKDKVNMVTTNKPIKSRYAFKHIDVAQKAISELNYEVRKDTIKYDDVIVVQRNLIYKQRDEVLTSKELEKYIPRMVNNSVESIIDDYKDDYDSSLEKLEDMLNDRLGISIIYRNDIEGDLEEYIKHIVFERVQELKDIFKDDFYLVIRTLLISAVDEYWIKHINNSDIVRKKVSTQSYNQKDPVQVFKMEISKEFKEMNSLIQEKFLYLLTHLEVTKN